MKRYNSKIGKGLIIILAAVLGGVSILMILTINWWGLAVVSLTAGFIAYTFLTTYYTISDHILKIKCGFMINKSIPINDIIKISESNNPVSSPANSIDRLEIKYSIKESILISPKDKVGFINHIQSINPKIKLTIDINELHEENIKN